jgi:uncharacterized paraquat-inducible protein A
MSIPVTCPNGHKHKVKDSLAGKVGLCPNCKAPIHVPEPSVEDAMMDILNPSESGLSGTGFLVDEIENEDADWSPEVPEGMKICPKCHAEVPSGASICGNCRTYIATL